MHKTAKTVLASLALLTLMAAYPLSASASSSSVTLSVGQKRNIYGIRGQCGEPAPSYAKVLSDLPQTDLGRFSDGGTGARQSGKCGGMVKVRMVAFTATKPGEDTFEITGDQISVRVK